MEQLGQSCILDRVSVVPRRKRTAEEVLMDLLAISFGNKPVKRTALAFHLIDVPGQISSPAGLEKCLARAEFRTYMIAVLCSQRTTQWCS